MSKSEAEGSINEERVKLAVRWLLRLRRVWPQAGMGGRWVVPDAVMDLAVDEAWRELRTLQWKAEAR